MTTTTMAFDEGAMNEPSILTNTTAIIIGAGPSGLSTALGLSKWCERVVLVEKHSEFLARGANFGIAPNGLKALEELETGTIEKLEVISVSTPFGGLLTGWSDMRDVLLSLVRAKANIEIRTGVTFSDIEDENDAPVKVILESGVVVEGDFLIGADGVHSSVREWLQFPPGTDTGSRVYRGHLVVEGNENPLLPVLERGVVPISGNFGGVFLLVFNFHPKIQGKLAWVLSTQQEVDDSTTPMDLMEGKIDDEEMRARIYAMFRGSDPAHWKPFRSTVVFKSEELKKRGWGGKKRVTLLGDAAHAMRPTDGQGGSMAFEDAVVLSRSLQNANTVEGALRKFEEERMTRVLKVHTNQEERFMARMRREKVGPWSPEFTKWVNDGV